MATIHEDEHIFTKGVTFGSTVSTSGASGPGVVKVLEVAFDLADIAAGSLSSDDIPAGAQILGAAIEMTEALTFDGSDTTGVTVKAGTSGDDDGYFAATQLSGVVGPKYLAAAGALVGCQVAGDTGACELVFAATGGSPDLADVETGAGVVRLTYTAIA